MLFRSIQYELCKPKTGRLERDVRFVGNDGDYYMDVVFATCLVDYPETFEPPQNSMSGRLRFQEIILSTADASVAPRQFFPNIVTWAWEAPFINSIYGGRIARTTSGALAVESASNAPRQRWTFY